MSALYCFEKKEKQGRYSLVSNVDIRVLRVTDSLRRIPEKIKTVNEIFNLQIKFKDKN